MRDAVHGEGVEPDFFFHDRKASRHALHGELSSAAGQDAGPLAEIVAFRLTLARQIPRARCLLPAGVVSRYGGSTRKTLVTGKKGRHDQNGCYRPGAPISSFRRVSRRTRP